MATIEGRATLTAMVTIALSENEARALNALTKYGTEAFLKTFYEHLGQPILKPYEMGLRSLFKSIENDECGIRDLIRRVDESREVFSGKMAAIKKVTQ